MKACPTATKISGSMDLKVELITPGWKKVSWRIALTVNRPIMMSRLNRKG
jgi:hypothetical protein